MTDDDDDYFRLVPKKPTLGIFFPWLQSRIVSELLIN